MSYNVLYRRFRPKTFSEVSGQDHIVKILQSQIRSGRVGHAYLFCGTKGTGKTTVARIFARTINCLHPQNGEACMHCSYCQNPTAADMDIIEIDGASNRGIDEIRELTDKVYYMPTASTYKVYIIDEVHMLTTEAFNALLKTLEEPPKHVVFIFATTSREKIPPTILSRTQRFDFARISDKHLILRMQHILSQLNIPWDDSALGVIASVSDGSFRDALGILDQCISITQGRLREKDVLEATGMVGDKYIFEIASCIIGADGIGAVKALRTLYEEGREISLLLSQLCSFFSDLLILPQTGEQKKSESYMRYIHLLKNDVQENLLVTYIEELGRLQNEFRYVNNLKALVEAKFIYLSSLSPSKGVHFQNVAASGSKNSMQNEDDALLSSQSSPEKQSAPAFDATAVQPDDQSAQQGESPVSLAETAREHSVDEPSADAAFDTLLSAHTWNVSAEESASPSREPLPAHPQEPPQTPPVYAHYPLHTSSPQDAVPGDSVSSTSADDVQPDFVQSIHPANALCSAQTAAAPAADKTPPAPAGQQPPAPASETQPAQENEEIHVSLADLKEVFRQIKVYVKNSIKDPLVVTSIDSAVISSFENNTVVVSPTPAMARMSERFVAKGGMDVLRTQFHERVSPALDVVYRSVDETPLGEDFAKIARKSFGELEEF